MKPVLRRYVTGWRRMVVPSLALLMLGAVGTHCDDDVCNLAEPYKCDGDSLLTCAEGAYSEGAVLVETDCSPGTCVEPDPLENEVRAMCAESEEQSQACLDNPDQGRVCDGSSYVYCYGGYVKNSIEECASADHCVIESGGYNGCVETVGKSPQCPQGDLETYSSTCDGAELLNCAFGYLVETVDCTAEDLCYTSEAMRTSKCILATEPDSRCEELVALGVLPQGGVRRGCDEEVAFACIDTYLVWETVCDTDEQICYNGVCEQPTVYIPPSGDACRAAPMGSPHGAGLLRTLIFFL